MSARDVIASELARISRVDMDEAPAYARASVRTAALHVERALTAAGYRILGPGELDAETVERIASSPLPPKVIAAAWRAWHSRHGGKLGPGPAFSEAITAALRALTQEQGR